MKYEEILVDSGNTNYKLYLGSYKPWETGEDFSKCVELIGENKTAALITNAWDLFGWSEKSETALREMTAFLQTFGIESERLDLREYFGESEGLAERLQSVGLIYAFGGESFVLRRAFRQSGLDDILPELLSKGAVYGGFSAGSCVMAPDLHGVEIDGGDDPIAVPEGYDGETIWEGLNLVPFRIAPHYKSGHPESPASDGMVKYFVENSLPYQTLRDGETIVDDTVSVKKYLKKEEK